MPNTHVHSARDLRNNYAEIAAHIKNNDHVIITNRGRGESVMIGMREFAQYEDYLHQKYIGEALAAAEVQANDPNSPKFSPDDVRKEIKERYGI